MDMNLSNNKVPQEFGFYAVLTNPVLGFEKLTEILVEEKIAFIQLRIKGTLNSKPQALSLNIAKNLRTITKGSNSKLIINDDPLLAMDVQADGVHLGQDDMPYDLVRQLVGEKMIIGLSTHNIEQVKQANILKSDYIGMGPVYKTPTKVIADPALGVSYLKEMMSHNKLPFVAIGGIDLSNVKDVLLTGAKNICAVRLIDQCKTKEEVREKLNLLFSE
jgi:thiamine-phosphate pyrophosphorylase